MKLLTILALAGGLALFGYVVARFDAGAVVAGVAAAGWGVLWVALYRFVTLAAHGMGWRALFPAGAAPGFLGWFRARWAGEAINALLPVGQVGGDVARALMVARETRSGALAGATVLVDFTLGLVAQFVYTLLGAALLFAAMGRGTPTGALLTGLLVAAAVLAGFVLAQNSMLLGRVASRMARGGDRWATVAGSLAEWNRETVAIYSDRRRVAGGFAWRMAGWLLLTGETWLVLFFLGHTTSWQSALVLESLTMGIRSAAFALPGALGVQEAAFVLIGPLVGVSAEAALALALVKRLRELIVGVPGLLVWTFSEGHRLKNLAR